MYHDNENSLIITSAVLKNYIQHSVRTDYSSTRRSPCRRYDEGGETLRKLWPIKSAIVTSMHVPDIFRDILESIFNDEKSTPPKKRRQLRKPRVVATLHNLS